MYLGAGGRARPAGEEVPPDRSTWPSGLANVRGLVTGTGGRVVEPHLGLDMTVMSRWDQEQNVVPL